MITNLPKIKTFDQSRFSSENSNHLFICSEGFEERSLNFVSQVSNDKVFTDSIIFSYVPIKKSRLDELKLLVANKCLNDPKLLNYNRFKPYDVEEKFDSLSRDFSKYSEITIDISVMSKLLILIIFNSLSNFKGTLRVIYSEPEVYSPSEPEFERLKNEISKSIYLPSFGVHNMIRTPLLSSIINQRCPSLVVAFLSFNEQLIKSLLSNINPTYLYLVNGVPPRLKWREGATSYIHNGIIKEYSKDNQLDSLNLLQRKTSTLYYEETFILLSKIYNENCINRRIIIAPTGSKMQAFACALIKIICPDIHIEYPTPESYYIEGYSSSKIINTYELTFENFSTQIKQVAEEYKLNG